MFGKLLLSALFAVSLGVGYLIGGVGQPGVGRAELAPSAKLAPDGAQATLP